MPATGLNSLGLIEAGAVGRGVAAAVAARSGWGVRSRSSRRALSSLLVFFLGLLLSFFSFFLSFFFSKDS